MRSIAFAALIGGMVPGLALAQGCAGHGEAKALLEKQQPLTAPIGRRYVVSAPWNDQPDRIEGENRITHALYQDLQKLSANGAVRVDRVKYEQPGWDKKDVPAAVVKGFSTLVVVTPVAIASEPSYHQQGDTFSVKRFDYANLQVVSVDQFRSSTDRYCVVQFTYRATYTPLLGVLADEPDNAQRKGRLLGIVDPFAHNWRVLAFDLAPQNRDFTTSAVADAVASLGLTR